MNVIQKLALAIVLVTASHNGFAQDLSLDALCKLKVDLKSGGQMTATPSDGGFTLSAEGKNANVFQMFMTLDTAKYALTLNKDGQSFAADGSISDIYELDLVRYENRMLNASRMEENPKIKGQTSNTLRIIRNPQGQFKFERLVENADPLNRIVTESEAPSELKIQYQVKRGVLKFDTYTYSCQISNLR